MRCAILINEVMLVLSIVAKEIKEARKAKGLTQQELADILQVTQATVQQYESGRRNPKPKTLQRIADALNMDFAALLGKATLIDGTVTHEEMNTALQAPTRPTAQQIGQAYDKATPPVQRTVEVALEPFMGKDAE